MTQLYTYKATVKEIYDGDTWTLDIDLGFYIIMSDQKIRLFGIDTPEVRGEERLSGLAVRDWCRENYPRGTELILQSIKDSKGKYGRWLGILHHNGRNINQYMIDTGRAKPANY